MSSFFERWSSYVTFWRKSNGYSKKQFSHEAHMDPRVLRDLEDQHFQSRFYSVASSAEYIRSKNLMKQLSGIHVENPEIYLQLIDTLDSLSPGKRRAVQSHFIEHFQLLKSKQDADSRKNRN